MSLNARLKRLEQRGNRHGLKHTPPVICYEADEEIPALIAQAIVGACCTVHVVSPMEGSR
jgi:hypothetical protein